MKTVTQSEYILLLTLYNINIIKADDKKALVKLERKVTTIH